jgi:hypothetical protein
VAKSGRTSISSSDPEREERELRALLDVLRRVHAETLAQLDRTDAALDAVLARYEASKRDASS